MKQKRNNLNKLQNENEVLNQSQNKQTKIDRLKGDMVSLINKLIDSIKEYNKVSQTNNINANQIFSYYEEEQQQIQNLFNDIINNGQYQRVSELYEENNILSKLIEQLKENSNSSLQNLQLFFDDAKLIVQNIRTERQKELKENKQNLNIRETASNISINSGRFGSMNFQSQFNKYYIKLKESLNDLAEFNYIIEGIDTNSANYFNNIKENMNKELNNLYNFINNFKDNNKSNILPLSPDIDQGNKTTRNNNTNLNMEFENLKIMNQIKTKQIKQLTMQLNRLKMQNNSNVNIEDSKKIKYLYTDINDSLIKKSIKEKDNRAKLLYNKVQKKQIDANTNYDNIQRIMKEKDNQILNLQQQLSTYEQNENNLNKQLDDLNNQFKNKIGQYEKQIILLKNKLAKNNNNNPKIKGEKKQDIIQENNLDMMKNDSNIISLNNKNMNLIKIIKQQKATINGLQNQIIIFKNQIDQYDQMNKKQLEEMNNSIFKNNKIIEQKDELIKKLREKKEIQNSQININMSNQTNNNELLLLKLENEKLKKDISMLQLPQNNNNLRNGNNISSLYNTNTQELQQLNIGLMEENNSLKLKNKQLESKIQLLTTNNEQLQNLNDNLKNQIVNLEQEIEKKKNEIDGLQAFINKLQSKLDAEDINVPKSNSTIKERKNMALTKEENTKKIQKFLDLLNKANKDINDLQKKNKELQFKLDDKQVQEELSGFRTEEANFSNYEEEFDLRKMVNGTKEKNRSEDINIDYPGMQGVKDRNKELKKKMNMLIEQVKILIANVNINSKIKPQINQICQLMRIPAQNIQMIISGKNKKKALGLFE
jgi:hypothetical protein